jgi:hypothetical protein
VEILVPAAGGEASHFSASAASRARVKARRFRHVNSTLLQIVDKVATCSYYLVMKAIARVGVKNLKNNLSAYLRQVRRGMRVLVTDRNEVVAELGQPQSDIASGVHPLLAEWISTGKLRPAMGRKKKLPVSPVRLPAGTAQRLLDAERGE